MLQCINLPQGHTFLCQAVMPPFCPVINAAEQRMLYKLFQASAQSLLRFHETVCIYEFSYLTVVECTIE